jgi:PIN domain nuclease of toxin-antitoxin system
LAAEAVFVSAATIWEISIKHALGPGRMPVSGRDALAQFSAAGFIFLPISPEHAAAIDKLAPLHRDPFDRMLIAQALTEPLRLLTQDETLVAYSDLVLLV